MINTRETGNCGEEFVASFLKSRGYIIVKRNYHCRFGEIDIIAENETDIVFVEVKTRDENFLVSGFEAVDKRKQKKIKITASDFLMKFHLQLQPRFDVAEVIVFKKDDGTAGYKLNYLKNAF